MNVFGDPQKLLKPHPPEPAGIRIAGTVLVASLVLSSALVVWYTAAESRAAHAAVAAWAQARAVSLELQLQQAASAVETLTSLARQAGGAPPSFQQVAGALLTSRPGIAVIELQPGGVVRDMVPRAGNEKAMGLNVLNDPAERAAANAAIQQHASVILAPAKLHNGEPGIVARGPVFLKGRDGQESFWGLVAVSIRLNDLAIRSQLEDLWKQGYSYSLLVPGSGQRKATGLLLRGEVSLGDAVQRPIKVHNLTLSLAVQPQGGWINKSRMVLCIVFTLLVSGLFWVGARLLESKRAMGLELADLQQRAEHDSRQRSLAEEESRSLKTASSSQEAELKKAQIALQQAQVQGAESAARLETQLRQAEQARDAAQAKAKAAEQAFSGVGDQLAAANQAGQEAAKAHALAREQTQNILQKTQAQMADLQRRLDETGRAYKEALAANLKQTADDQEAIAALQARLEAAEKDHAAKTADLEKRHRELSTLLKKTATAEEQAAELSILLQETRAKLEQRDAAATELEVTPTNETPAEPKAAVPGEPLTFSPAEPVAPLMVDSLAGAPVDEIQPAAPTDRPEPGGTTRFFRPGKRKKSRRDTQMDLFAAPVAPEESTTQPAVADIDSEVAEAWPIEPESQPATSAITAETPDPIAVTKRPSTPETRAAADLPEIKGLSAAEGLAWADGNSERFLKALRDFAQRQTGTGEKIRAALEQGDSAAAEHAARALKSAAGEIGAAPLAEIAAALARAIHERAEPGDLETAWSEVETSLHELVLELKAALNPKEETPRAATARHLPAPPPLNPALFRRAVNLILPLLTDGDPGARDCLKDNRNTFRSGFTPEGYADFEQMVKQGDYGGALESLKKAAKKHGLA